MAATVEEKVVEMKFDNAAFKTGVAESLKSLADLNKGLQLQGATKGLEGIGTAAKAQTGALKNVESGVQSIADRFKAMSVVAITALANVTNQAISAGGRLLKSFTVAPITEGFKEYELTLNSVQTIMANTGREGKKGLREVSKYLEELNRYSDQTIYNFGEMAKNIGTFTAAGVDLHTATAAIKGIANVAALSGANSQKAAGAMYQLSQAISAGKVSLEDWNSVEQAGLGGKVLKDSLIETARAHGVSVDAMIKKHGSFRLSIQEGWITSKILTETFAKFTGDLSDAQLKQLGYTEEQIKGIQKLARIAKESATKVKTFTQLMGTLKEAAGSGWANTWKLIFGDFYEARELFTGVDKVLGGFIIKSAETRNKVVADWKEMGGRTVLIQGIGNAWKALVGVMKPISDAFREIFPRTTAKDLYNLTVSFKNFTQGLIIGGETAENLRRTFAGVFAIFGIGWEIIKQVARTFFGLFDEVGKGSGGFLETTASIGDFLVALHKAVKEGDGLTKFFQGLGVVLAIPIKILRFFGDLLGSIFSNVDSGGAVEKVTGLSKKLEPLGRLGQMVSTAWGKVVNVFDDVVKFFGPIGDKFAEFFGELGNTLAGMFDGLDWGNVLAGINTGLFAGLVLMVRNMIGGGGVGGMVENLGDAFENLSNSLGAMTNTLRAATLLQIAIAVGILAVSMNVLSKIDGKGLARASAAITGMFIQLGATMLIFEKFSTFNGFLKMPFIAGSMILLGVAVNILAIAVKKLSDLSWEELAKGLTGVTALLAAVVLTSRYMGNPAGMISTAAGMVVLGLALQVLVKSVTELSGLSWEEMAKGLIGVGSLLAALALFTKFAAVNKGGLIQGAGIILLATGIKILASAMKDLGELSWTEIAKGLVAMGGALVVMGAALALIPPTAIFSAAGILVVAASLGMIADALEDMGGMKWGEIGKGLAALAGALVLIGAALILIPPSSLLSAAAILVVAASLGLIADALGQMGSMDWEEIAKGLVALAGSLGIIAVAMIFMTGALPGAAALLVVAGALAILTPILMALGEMSWGEILKGLVALAGVFVVLGVAGLVLASLVPALIGLGLAITLLGVGVLAAGAGVLLFATGLTALAAAGTAGTLAIVAMISALAGVIPTVLKQLGLGLVAFAKVIATAGPAFTKAIVAVIGALIDAIVKLIPKIVDALFKMLSKMLDTMLKYVPKMVDTGIKLIIGILDGFSKNADKLSTAGANAIIAFLKGVQKNLPRVIEAGVDLVVSFLESLASSIRKNSERVNKAGIDVATAIIDGMTLGLRNGVSKITDAARSVASGALNAAKDFLGIDSPSKEFEKLGIFVNKGFAKGLLGGSKQEVNDAFNSLKGMLKDMMKDSAADVKDATAKLKELTSAREKDEKAIRKVEKALASARKEHNLSTQAFNKLTKSLVDEKTKLGNLATQYEKVTEKLDAAKNALADAIKTRDDYNKQIKDQYSALPDITEETKLDDYVKSLEQEVRDTQEFASVIQRLRDMGLNDRLYEDFLSKGIQALPFLKQMLAAGKYSVDQVNRLDSQVVTLASNLGKKASTELYQAGVDGATKLVKGLESQQNALVAAMEALAKAMLDAINKILDKGLINVGRKLSSENYTSPIVSKFAEDGTKVLGPKVDTSDFDRKLSSAGKTALTYSLAANTSKTMKSTAGSDSSGVKQVMTSSTVYNQYNNSPKALAAADIYRQTSNLISTKKGA